MKKFFVSLFCLLVLGIFTSAQDTVTVTTLKANLRGTPTNTGIVVTTVVEGETFELIKEKAPWYLVQTPKYVGWIHGNGIRMGSELPDLSAYESNRWENQKPRKTTKPITGTEADSPFREEYVGGDTSIIHVTNSSNRTMNLNFGGVRYVLANAEKKTIEVDGGNYEFTASAPGVRSKTGVREFRKGSSYTWNFFIVTVRR